MFYRYFMKILKLKVTKISNIKVNFHGDKNKTNHCNLKLNYKLLCKILKSQCGEIKNQQMHNKF